MEHRKRELRLNELAKESKKKQERWNEWVKQYPPQNIRPPQNATNARLYNQTPTEDATSYTQNDIELERREKKIVNMWIVMH